MIDPYIERLEEEKSNLEGRIKELRSEIRAINNLIYRKKSEDLANKTGQSINMKSGNRIFFEAVIIDVINLSKKGLRTREVYDALIKKNFSIKYATLRSYITKMRDKGLIRKSRTSSYYWIASKEPSKLDE